MSHSEENVIPAGPANLIEEHTIVSEVPQIRVVDDEYIVTKTEHYTQEPTVHTDTEVIDVDAVTIIETIMPIDVNHRDETIDIVEQTINEYRT